MIVFTSSIWTAIAAAVVLGESFGWPQTAAAAVSFLGVVLVARPAFLFGDVAGEEGASPAAHAGTATLGGAEVTASRGFAIGAGLCSAVTASGAYLSIRKLKGVNTMVVVSLYGVVGVLVSLVMLFSLQAWTPPQGASQWALLIGIGCLGAAGQWLLNGGFQREKAGIGSLMRNVDILCAFIWQATILQEAVSPWSVGGAFAVFAGTAAVAILKARAVQQDVGAEEVAQGEGPGGRAHVKHVPLATQEEDAEVELAPVPLSGPHAMPSAAAKAVFQIGEDSDSERSVDSMASFAV